MRLGRLVVLTVAALLAGGALLPEGAEGRGSGGGGGKRGGGRGGKGKGRGSMTTTDRKEALKLLEVELFTADREDRYDVGRSKSFERDRDEARERGEARQRHEREDERRNDESRCTTPR